MFNNRHFARDLNEFFYKRDEKRKNSIDTEWDQIQSFLTSKVSWDDYLTAEELINSMSAVAEHESFKRGFIDGMKFMTYMNKENEDNQLIMHVEDIKVKEEVLS